MLVFPHKNLTLATVGKLPGLRLPGLSGKSSLLWGSRECAHMWVGGCREWLSSRPRWASASGWQVHGEHGFPSCASFCDLGDARQHVKSLLSSEGQADRSLSQTSVCRDIATHDKQQGAFAAHVTTPMECVWTQLCADTGDSRDELPPPLKTVRLWGKATPGFLSAQTNSFTRHRGLKCLTRLSVCGSTVCACLISQNMFMYVWICRC